MLTLERINHSDHKSRPFGNKVSLLTTNHGYLPSYNSQKIFFNLFSIGFHILGFIQYDMQSLSEIYSPHTTILIISGEGVGGHRGGHYFKFTNKKSSQYLKRKKIEF